MRQKKIVGMRVVAEESDFQVAETMMTFVASLEEIASVPNVAKSNCLLLLLPYEILTNNVLGYLRPEDMLSLGACNKESKIVSEDGYLWQSLFQQKFPSGQLTPSSMQEWKRA